MTPDMKELPAELGALAGKLTEAQRALISGDYDPQFARVEDASALIDMGLWSYDAEKQIVGAEYYQLDFTPLGRQVAAHLQANPIPDLDSKEVGR